MDITVAGPKVSKFWEIISPGVQVTSPITVVATIKETSTIAIVVVMDTIKATIEVVSIMRAETLAEIIHLLLFAKFVVSLVIPHSHVVVLMPLQTWPTHPVTQRYNIIGFSTLALPII